MTPETDPLRHAVDLTGVLTTRTARRWGADVAERFPDRHAMAVAAAAFLAALPSEVPRPAAGLDAQNPAHQQAAQRQWAGHLSNLRAAYARGYAAGRAAWAEELTPA